MVEHDGPIDDQQRDRRTGRRLRGRRRVSIEQPRRLVRDTAHEPAGHRRKIGEAWPSQGSRERDQRGAGVPGAGPGQERPSHVLQPRAGPVDDHDCRRVSRHERVPTPALGTLDRLEHDPRTVTSKGREEPDRRHDVGEQLGPDRDERPRSGKPFEGIGARLDAQVLVHRVAPRSAYRYRTQGTPDRWSGARGARGRWGQMLGAAGLHEPSHHTQVIPNASIERMVARVPNGRQSRSPGRGPPGDAPRGNHMGAGILQRARFVRAGGGRAPTFFFEGVGRWTRDR